LVVAFKGFPPFLSSLLIIASPLRERFLFLDFRTLFSLFCTQVNIKAENGITINTNKATGLCRYFYSAFVIDYRLNKQADRYFSIHQIINATIIFAALNWLILYYKESKVFQYYL
jgi:hypothetical protein